MNDPLHEKLFILKRDRLTDEERATLFARIEGHVAQTPLRVSYPLRSPFARRVGVAGALALFLVSFGISYAAERALPGEPLYAVKVHVNEGIARALAVTPESKAKVAESELKRRAVEVETLSLRVTLDEEVRGSIVKDVTRSIDDLSSAHEELRRKGKDDVALESLRAAEATIAAHRAAFEGIGVSDLRSGRSDEKKDKKDEGGRKDDDMEKGRIGEQKADDHPSRSDMQERSLNGTTSSSTIREDNESRNERESERTEREDDEEDEVERPEDGRSGGREPPRIETPSAR